MWQHCDLGSPTLADLDQPCDNPTPDPVPEFPTSVMGSLDLSLEFGDLLGCVSCDSCLAVDTSNQPAVSALHFYLRR